MQYVKLGSTGMMVSRVGFGGIPILRESTADAIKVLRRAFEGGINYVDTHRSYGDSELKIGRGLADVREQYYLSTKIANHTRRGAEKSLAESLKRLRTDYIDLLYMKNLDSDEAIARAMGPNGSLAVVRRAQKAGIVRHIGFTSHTEKAAYKALRTGEYEAVMFPYSLVNTAAEKRILGYCRKHDIGFVCMKPVAGGLLTVPSRVFAKMTSGRARTTAAAAMRFCLSGDGVATVIPGLNKLRHVREALSALDAPMTQAQRARAAATVVRLGEGFCRNCGYCKPCPEAVDINNVFRFWHYWSSYDLKEYARSHYKALKVPASACVACGQCLPRCPYDIDIPRKLRAAHRALSG